ncbi:hypothetical protein M404DRAFT_308306 [Pisolithus tinctorius Marx 270]|uniref:Uncharacterized protein n=1 Tax=Pisolithus tinctorius Marx 270 TaxID=870435 RepID=A0A0C3PKI2_PISTI|nr:hypothetical protein M404DRAFT_308306 [Pisolithus tinctorius Marx 270]
MDKAKADARSHEEELLKEIELLQSRVRRSSSVSVSVGLLESKRPTYYSHCSPSMPV